MTPSEAIRRASTGDIGPITIVAGPEVYLVEQVVSAIRAGAFIGEGAGAQAFNEDKLTAGEASIERVLSTARSLPMMSRRRLVLVRSIERWDTRGTGDAKDDGDDRASAPGSRPRDAKEDPLERLATYAEDPSPSTCLVLAGSKIDTRRKLVLTAKKKGWLVACEPLSRGALPSWIAAEATVRGHAIADDVADELAEMAGPELAHVADALERVSLYVGTGAPITRQAIEISVIRLRQSTVWELVGAVGRRDLGAALSALGDVYDPRDRGIRLVGLLAWSVRQLIKLDSALKRGAGPEDAARQAGAPPFKARELAGQAKKLGSLELQRWLELLAATDLALKGSRRPPQAVLEEAIVSLCGSAG